MIDLLTLMQTRRSIRRYDPREVPQHLVQQVLEAARWAPSAHNRQPWRFVVITESEAKVNLATAMGKRLRADLTRDNVPEVEIEKDVSRSYERITQAPVLILLALSMVDMDAYPDERRSRYEHTLAVQGVALAGQNLLLMAHYLGLGACWVCAPLFVPDVVQQALELPADWEAQALITMGYPAEIRERTRQPLEEKVLWR